MKTIGKVLQEQRVKKKFSRDKLESKTKIKKEFIVSIEKEEWEKLPDYPVVSGFVKSIAGTLNFNQKQAMALLRRDYPPKALPINPKPDVGKRLSWSPRTTFVTGIILITIIFIGYLGFQYIGFISPPTLTLTKPQDGQTITQPLLIVEGTSNPQAVVTVNNQPVIVEEDGKFITEVESFEGIKVIEVKAVSRSGKETVLTRRIVPELDK